MFLPGGLLSQDNDSPDAPRVPAICDQVGKLAHHGQCFIALVHSMSFGSRIWIAIKYFLSRSQLFYCKFRVQPKSDHLKYLIVFLWVSVVLKYNNTKTNDH